MADTRRRYNQRNNDPHKEYKRLVRNTKSKFQRLEDNFGKHFANKIKAQIDIPDFTKLNTPEKFDKFVDEMTSFTDRGNKNYQFEVNKYGVVYPKSLAERGENASPVAQKNAQEFIDRYKEKEFQINGEKAGYTVGDRMTLYEKENAGGISVPNDFDVDNYQSLDRLEGAVELYEEKAEGIFFDRSMRQMKENFMKVIKGTFNSVGDDIVEMLDIMPEDDFFELYLMTAEFNFEDYGTDGIEGTEEQAELLRSYLKNYFLGNVDMSLKGF